MREGWPRPESCPAPLSVVAEAKDARSGAGCCATAHGCVRDGLGLNPVQRPCPGHYVIKKYSYYITEETNTVVDLCNRKKNLGKVTTLAFCEIELSKHVNTRKQANYSAHA